jgi:hypothetical protein
MDSRVVCFTVGTIPTHVARLDAVVVRCVRELEGAERSGRRSAASVTSVELVPAAAEAADVTAG